MSAPMVTIVLVHGAWHGGWCWERVVPLLEGRGLTTRTVDLPSVGARPGAGTDLSADAAAVERVVAEVSGPVVLCGHSYGGMVISRVEAKNVARLIYLCAFMPAEGESLLSIGGGKPAPWIQMLDGGLVLPDPAKADTVFYTDCDEATRRWAKSKLRPQSAATMGEPVQRPAWRRVPSTYVVCANDQALFADIQRNVFVPRATETVELQADHSPFLSQPPALADVLAARGTAGR
jgi:pimeloyl-ACP methyl ester carboxylesterase